MIEQQYKCDHCEAIFKAKDVLLKPINTNVHIFGTPILVINNGTIFKTLTSEAKKDDMLMCCPKCEKAHIFGFDKYLLKPPIK